MKFKKIGTIATAATLSVGLLATPAFAQTPPGIQEKPQQLDILVASTETIVSKSELIKKFKEIFPNKYDFLKESDFQLSSGYYSDDETIRYSLDFHKRLSGNRYTYGRIIFSGDQLEIESLYLEPVDVKDAMFPAKVSKDEAKRIALRFIQQFTADKNYELSETGDFYYYPGDKQLLTEPVRYNFDFVRTVNGIPIPEQNIFVTVLGNGEISQFYRSEFLKSTFDDASKAKSKEEILNQIKNDLSVQLQYKIDYDYLTDQRKVELVYVPNISEGVHALTGQYLAGAKFQSNPPSTKNAEMITNLPLPANYQGLTVAEAKRLAEKLLKINSDKVRLNIDSVEERENYDGKEVIDVSYSYTYNQGGFGTSLTFDKQTGDLIEYYDIKDDVLREIEEKPKNQRKLTEQQALAKAIDYLKQYAPSQLHYYSKPIKSAERYYNKDYHFTFPRIVNGIPVLGDEIQISVSETGELSNLYIRHFENDQWPDIGQAIPEEEAKQIISDSLNVELSYVRPDYESKQYALVYTPIYNGNMYSYLDAISGEWKLPGYFEEPKLEEPTSITHPTAEKELNFFIENGYLEIGDAESFNPDSPITKGEVLNALVKSFTYFYEEYYSNEETTQTYENIGPDHPYFSVVEKAVVLGILNPNNKGFATDSTITREQLAVWYIRTLGLEEAAKHADIYKINVEDAGSINPNYIGYVALANTLGLIPAENNRFEPKRPVTYAEFATSAVRLAHKVEEMDIDF